MWIASAALAQTPPESPDQPAPSAPLSPIDLPAVERVGDAQLEPPAATNAKQVTPAQEASEIRASGRFLAPLIPEGGLLVRASGTLARDDFAGVWTIELLDRIEGAQGRSLILLPSEPLADMIARHAAAVDGGGAAPPFEVSGRVLVFQGRNFLLPTFAVPIDQRIARAAPARFVPPGARRETLSPAATPQPIATGAPLAQPLSVQSPSVQAPSVQPPSVQTPSAQTPSAPPAAMVDPETFSRDLESRLNARVAVVPSSGDPSMPAEAAPAGIEQPAVATIRASDSAEVEMPLIEARVTPTVAVTTALAARSALPLLPPTRIQSRRGTLTRDPVSGTWRFVFASGVKEEGDLSLELLPCSTLTSLVTSHRARRGNPSVLLTADVTVFEGRNYLRPVRYQPLVAGKWITP